MPPVGQIGVQKIRGQLKRYNRETAMALKDTRLRNLKPLPDKAERLVADGNGLYVRVRAGEGKNSRISRT